MVYDVRSDEKPQKKKIGTKILSQEICVRKQRVPGGGGEDASLGEPHRRLPLTYEQVKQEITRPQFLFPLQQCFL